MANQSLGRRAINQIPNLMTCIALCYGALSMYLSSIGETKKAAYFILYAVMFDKMDGAAARLLGAQSEIGAQLDSFGDYTSFGCAPSFLLVALIRERGDPFGPLSWLPFELPFPWILVGALIYLCASARRLAVYNVIDQEAEKLKFQQKFKKDSSFPPMDDHNMGLFTGVPSTMCGGFLALLLICAEEYGYPEAKDPKVFAILQVILAYLMNCTYISLPKLGRKMSMFWKVATLANVSGTWLCLVLNVHPWYPFGAVIFSATAGPILAYQQKKRLLAENPQKKGKA